MKLVNFWLVMLLTPVTLSAEQPIVNVCDDQAEFPPYTYYERVNGQKNTSKISGAMMDVLTEITKLTGFSFSVKLLPWSRCLYEIATKDKFEMYMNAIYTKKRGEMAYMTKRIYTMSRGYWYSKEKYPNGLVIDFMDELKNYRLLGVYGWSYETYGIQDEDKIFVGKGKNYSNAFEMLKMGRGDILLGGYPVAYGFESVGQKIAPNGFQWSTISSAPPSEFHIFISKRSPRAKELLTKINQAIDTLNKDNTIDTIFKHYIQCGKHC
ncbi:amino acid ABC transporter [Oleiphilus messinensis]|uniref:Amino acid ABC transporter n=2 Tax=Oleiphilus messinensis TaxID=141451 RepID=A0A1Y0I7Y7_9GAMM|nr:amino acid ABC transporter [Oleiphilus messinensis]